MPLALSVIVVILVYKSLYNSNITNMVTILWSLIAIVPILSQFIQTRLSLSILESSFIQIQRITDSLSVPKVQLPNVTQLHSNYDILLSNVSYSIDGTDIIKNINFRIPKSKFTCVVGHSGSGKSTLIDLIIGLKSPVSGNIFYNNIDSLQIDYPYFRKNLGYVAQDPVKLNGSIRDNIFWRKESISDADFKELVDFTDCGFIWNLPMQLDEFIGENGVQLSGGQWQRLSILRAIVNKPKFLILDEATSALDMASELKVVKGMKSLRWSPTILMVSHRPGPIESTDKILNLSEK